MNVPPRVGHDFGRATPSLRHAQRAKHRKPRNPAGPHLSLAGNCSDKQSQLCSGESGSPRVAGGAQAMLCLRGGSTR